MTMPVAPGTTDRPDRMEASVTRPCPWTSTVTSMVASVARRMSRFDAHRLLARVQMSRRGPRVDVALDRGSGHAERLIGAVERVDRGKRPEVGPWPAGGIGEPDDACSAVVVSRYHAPSTTIGSSGGAAKPIRRSSCGSRRAR